LGPITIPFLITGLSANYELHDREIASSYSEYLNPVCIFTMVRVKNRYLVVNYLYPYPETSSNTKDALPGALQFHKPTPDEFHQGKLMRAIQDGVAELFGDYGSGMVGTTLKGTPNRIPYRHIQH
jgi:RNase P/RNase MRP subunit POP5